MVKASGRRMKWNSAVAQRIKSGQTGEVDGEEGGGGAKLDDEVAVADGIHGVLGQLREAEEPGDQGAVQGEGGAGEGAGAQRTEVDAAIAGEQAGLVAFEHFDIGEQMMGERDGLGALQMGVAGDDDVGVFFAQFDEGGLQAVDFQAQEGDFLAEPQTHVQGDLIVAGAAGVQLRAGRDAAGEGGLDVHVNVLQVRAPGEFAGDNLAGDGGQAVFDGAGFPGGEDADFFEHGGMGQGAEDVVLPEAPIKGDGLGEPGDVGVRAAAEAAAARNWGGAFHPTAGSVRRKEGKVTRQMEGGVSPGGEAGKRKDQTWIARRGDARWRDLRAGGWRYFVEKVPRLIVPSPSVTQMEPLVEVV